MLTIYNDDYLDTFTVNTIFNDYNIYTTQAILAQAIGSRLAGTFVLRLNLSEHFAMDRLCASIAFARRTARRLDVPQVADKLSQLLHEVHLLRQVRHEHVQAGDTYEPEVVDNLSVNCGDPNTEGMTRKPKRSKRTAAQPLETPVKCNRQLQTCREHSALEEPTVPQTHATDLVLTQDDVINVLSPECEVENLRLLIRQQLRQIHAVDAEHQGTLLNQLCEQSFEAVANSKSQHLVIQVFRARSHMLFLEECLGFVAAKQSGTS